MNIAKLLADGREPAIWFRTVDEPVSKSRWGGLPSLPDGVEWPVHRNTGMPLHFIAQVDLAALPATPLAGCPFGAMLPREGMLFFFYDIDIDYTPPEESPISEQSCVIFSPTSGDDREAPEDLPTIGHEPGEPGGGWSKDKVLPERHLRAYVIDTFWIPSNVDTNDAEREPTFQSVVQAIGEEPSSFESFEDIPTPEPSCYTVGQHKVFDGPQMFGADVRYAYPDEVRSRKTVLLLQIPVDADGARGHMKFEMPTKDLNARRFDRAGAMACFT